MRPIDADALMDKVNNTFAPFVTLLSDAPTVDAVPVVRCGDCVLMKKGEIMTIDEAIEKIDEDLHRLDLEDVHDRESREAINYLETMRRWIKDAKERYAK